MSPVVLGLLLAKVYYMWYAVPLIVTVSLVYAATRHESMDHILAGAARIGAWICGFMIVVFGILMLISAFV